MAPGNTELSVAELERLLLARKQQLDDLLKKRSQLQRELQKVDTEIASLNGPGKAAPAMSARDRRMQNSKSLRQLVLEYLSASKQGLTLAQMSELILASGYKTSSTNFRNVLYQCLYNTREVYHDEASGTYKLKGPPQAPKRIEPAISLRKPEPLPAKKAEPAATGKAAASGKTPVATPKSNK